MNLWSQSYIFCTCILKKSGLHFLIDLPSPMMFDNTSLSAYYLSVLLFLFVCPEDPLFLQNYMSPEPQAFSFHMSGTMQPTRQD